MAPPHLHPRSRTTSSLFATTVVLSFFVVALPHVLPCPAPRGVYADDGEVIDANGKRRRRRRPQDVEVKNGLPQFNNANEDGDQLERSRRECPVPKPGVLRQLLGGKKTNNDKDGNQ